MPTRPKRPPKKPVPMAFEPAAPERERKKPGAPSTEGLSALERAFLLAYLTGAPGVRGNAIGAAREAGYSDANTGVGTRLTRRPTIRAAIDGWYRKHDVTADRVLAEMARVGFSDIRDTAAAKELQDVDDHVGPAVQEWTEYTRVDLAGVEHRTRRVKLHPKFPALEAMGRHLKLFPSIHGTGGEQPRVAVFILNGIPEGKFRAAAAKLAQRALEGNGA